MRRSILNRTFDVWRFVFVIALALTLSVAHAEEKNSGKATKSKTESAKELERIVETTHSVTIDGQKVEYVARAGTLPWTEDNEDAKAKIFFVSYSKTGVTDPSTRPITFSFNGGPGSSSVWLHLGLLGPRRVYLDDEGVASAPPYHLVDNEYSLLDKTDLVFIDPVSTGYSRAVGEEDPHQFHGLREDVKSVGEFIRLYTTKYKRWSSPKFLIGESYGTTRAAGLSGYLQDNHGLYLNGIMLVSSILNFQTARFDAGNDLPYILFLPTYTATAWYHKRLDSELQRDLQATLSEVEKFALGEYANALMQGDNLSADQRANIIRKLARYTGLSEKYIAETNMRIHIFRFTKELLRDSLRTAGRLDSRFLGIDSDAAGESFEYDPSYANILGPYSGALNDYVRRELNYESALPYEILTGKVHPWNYSSYKNRYVNVAETLRKAMTKNPHLKVYVASGYYDLATPFLATDYTLSHLGLDESLRDNITVEYYEAGHMMYIHLPSLQKQRNDLVEFLTSALHDN